MKVDLCVTFETHSVSSSGYRPNKIDAKRYILIRCYFIEVCRNFHQNENSYLYEEAREENIGKRTL